MIGLGVVFSSLSSLAGVVSIFSVSGDSSFLISGDLSFLTTFGVTVFDFGVFFVFGVFFLLAGVFVIFSSSSSSSFLISGDSLRIDFSFGEDFNGVFFSSFGDFFTGLFGVPEIDCFFFGGDL